MLEEIAGECRVYASEREAVEAVLDGGVWRGDLLVVTGCGARGGPGLLALDGLGAALAEAGLDVPVLTDGLPPSKAGVESPWISLFSPEPVSGGVMGLLRDGDTLRFDLVEGRIRTGISADELESREPFVAPERSPFGYAARYARSALPALEGAGFG
ncbi:IlvD/Edd family dehydratase [Rubrobacter marinus]|uniref:dihydroxy-acid dehydratase domain-containing protein n=1 Tax=Rubrobacter marinus TaxID=2653852 RepID=UPI00140727EB|nr:dihydroxy-acid dehydratase [Rubrobacter marinus]